MLFFILNFIQPATITWLDIAINAIGSFVPATSQIGTAASTSTVVNNIQCECRTVIREEIK